MMIAMHDLQTTVIGEMVLIASALVAVGTIWRYVIRPPLRYFRRLEDVMVRVENQTNGQLADQFDRLHVSVDEIREIAADNGARTAVLERAVQALIVKESKPV